MTLTELFTNIANAIRAKTGSTEPIIAEDFPSAIEAIPVGSTIDLDAEVTEQEGLIEQIEATLVGKAVSSGIEVETCTVEIIPPLNKNNLRYLGIWLNVLEDKKIVESDAGGTSFEAGNHIVVENVVCGSFIVFDHNMSPDYNIIIDGDEYSTGNGAWYDIGTIPHKNNEIVTIELQNA